MDEINKNLWPGWDTVDLIGRGSFGEVYKIQRNVFGNVEYAALKVISIPQNAGDIEEMYSDGYDEASITSTFRSHLESIVAEYSLMRKMSGSANIVNCDDLRYVQHQDGIGWDIFIKMELLTPLTKALPAQIPEETVVKVAKDMCAALELCKKHDIIHRDIKPQNIFVSPNGDYKLGDFGIAKTVEKTMGGTKIGTYKYMAPEVYNNQPYGSGADIYSLGLVLYWMLNERRLPFLPLPPEKLLSGAEEAARHRRFSGEPLPPPAHGSEELKWIVLKACAYDPRVRYASAAEMQHDLGMLSGKIPIPGMAQISPHGISTNCPQPSAATLGAHTIAPTAQTVARSNATVLSNPANSSTVPTPSVHQVDNRQGCSPQSKKKVSPFVWLAGIAVAAALILVLFADSRPSGNANNSSLSTDSGQYNDNAYKDDSANKAEHVHNWIAATCTSAKRCRDCGITEGKPLEHNWQAATCTSAKKCRNCGKTEGQALGHDWPYSSSSKTCSRCGMTLNDTTSPSADSSSTKITLLPTKSYSDDKYVYRGTVTDVFGEVHKDVYYSRDKNASFIICPNGNYTKFTCRIYTVAGIDRGGDKDIHIHVYLDGVFSYESDLVSCENNNFVFTLNIAGVHDIRLKIDDAVIVDATVS